MLCLPSSCSFARPFQKKNSTFPFSPLLQFLATLSEVWQPVTLLNEPKTTTLGSCERGVSVRNPSTDGP